MKTFGSRKFVLLTHTETETCTSDDVGAVEIFFPDGNSYFVRPRRVSDSDQISPPTGSQLSYVRYPIVLWSDGLPWDEANLWVREVLATGQKRTDDIGSVVADLVAYLRFIEEDEEHPVDWTNFSARFAFARPTYKYKTYLNDLVATHALSHSTAQRRINTVVQLYRWLIDDQKILITENAPWKEKIVYHHSATDVGDKISIPIRTTDLKVVGAPAPDPTNDTVSDGGLLRPLNIEEQHLIHDALVDYDNYELQLMHTGAIRTGARIGSLLTLRKKHFSKSLEPSSVFGTVDVHRCPQLPQGYVVIYIGPGHAVDTKFSKRHTLYFPVDLYEQFHVYIHSDRARKRRIKAEGGDIDDQYFFLTRNCNPWYVSKELSLEPSDKNRTRRTQIRGGSVRELVRAEIIPRISKAIGSKYSYRLHDLRATYGVNEINRLLNQPKDLAIPDGEKWNLTEVLIWVAKRLNHSNLSVTEGYVEVRKMATLTRRIQDLWEESIYKKNNNSL
jgi:hypothetical protein